jgi:chemotaxis signal transduction protein
VALLFERIANTITIAEDAIQCIPVLLRKRLQRPWFLGVYSEQDDAPLLVLDLRQIAQDVMLASKEKKPPATPTTPANHMSLS